MLKEIMFALFTSSLVFLVSILALCLSYWIIKNFGAVSVDQIMSHITIDFNGLFTAGASFIRSFIKTVVLPTIILTSVFVFISLKKPLFIKKISNQTRSIALFLLLTISIVIFFRSFSVLDYFALFFGPDTFSEKYFDPNNLIITKRNPKSLILIYLESIENTYSNTKVFKEDLIKDLSVLKKKGISVNNYRPNPGGTWTMAAIVSTQCGIPLKKISPTLDVNSQGEHITKFLPSAKCLGGILKSQGYTNVFMGGASLSFSGKGLFFKDHHYDEFFGKEEWIAMGEDPKNIHEWGLYDDRLLVRARQKLQELLDTKDLFNLTILTLDTHHINGFLSPSCSPKKYKGFQGVLKCSSELVSSFINDIINDGVLSRANIIIIGDHLAMANNLYDKFLASDPNRTIFNVFISEDKKTINSNNMIQFDILPSTLDFIGLSLRRGRAGLGYSIFTNATKVPNRNNEQINSFLNYSETYNNLWNNREI